MAFLDLVNKRLDYLEAYNSARHYQEYLYAARRWVKRWENLSCSEFDRHVVEEFILERNQKGSGYAANKEIRYLRSTFNFGKKRGYITENPTDGIDFLPVEKKVKYVPPPEDVEKVIDIAEPEVQDYLITIRDTMGRMSEINQLTWDDVNFREGYVILYTRKKKGGHLTPRKVPMTQRLYEVLFRRYQERDVTKPWVFWHTYTSSKTGEKKSGPYRERKKIMKTLCKRAGVKHFRFHAMRHSGASIMENNNVPIGSIQRILGHENRSTTEIYLHSIGTAEKDAMSVFESATKNHTQVTHESTHNKKGVEALRP